MASHRRERRSIRARGAGRVPTRAGRRRAARCWSRARAPSPRPRFARRSSLRFSCEQSSPLIGDELLCYPSQIAIDDPSYISEAAIDPVIGHAILRKVVGANLLGAFAAADLRASQRIDRLFLLAAFAVVEHGAQHLHRLFAVLRL